MNTIFSTLPAEVNWHIAEYLNSHDKQALSRTCVALRYAYGPLSFENCFLAYKYSYTNLDAVYRRVPVQAFLQPQRYEWFCPAQVRTVAITDVPTQTLVSLLSTADVALFATPGGQEEKVQK